MTPDQSGHQSVMPHHLGYQCITPNHSDRAPVYDTNHSGHQQITPDHSGHQCMTSNQHDKCWEYMCIYISGWIFQKVLAEIVQKDLILSQKALISNRRNLGLFAPTSMRFPSKDSQSKDLSFQWLKYFTSDFSLLAKCAQTFVL